MCWSQPTGTFGRHPPIGSLRYALQSALPGLRSWRLKVFSYLVFSVESDGHIDVRPVLHARRDVLQWLLDTGEMGDNGSGGRSA
jgi:toxin ParE1/3/4